MKPRSERNVSHPVLELTLVSDRGGVRKWEYIRRGAMGRRRERSSVGVVVGMMTSIVIAVHVVFWFIGLIE